MRLHYLVLAAATLSVATACSSPDPSPPADAKSVATATEPPPAKARAAACDLVSGAEMSAILGGKVSAAKNDRSNGKTECIYTSEEGVSPYAELSVEWGSGESAMVAANMMNQREPGIADPYEGIGDQAVSMGPTLMIRSGDDLITIVFSGVDDAPGKARRIYDTVKAGM